MQQSRKQCLRHAKPTVFFFLDLRASSEGEENFNNSGNMFDLSNNLLDLDVERKRKFELEDGTSFVLYVPFRRPLGRNGRRKRDREPSQNTFVRSNQSWRPLLHPN